MARITVEDCLKVVGNENRFALIHLAVERIRQHRQGAPFLVKRKNKEVVMTLREIAAGLVTPENIIELRRQHREFLAAERAKRREEEEKAAAEAAGAAAEDAAA